MFWIAFGDVHESTSVLAEIPDLEDAEAVIITGDLTNNGNRTAAGYVVGSVENINKKVLAQPGNMDTVAVGEYLTERDMNLHLQVRELASGLGIMGVGMSTITPFNTPGEVPEDTLVAWLNETFEAAREFDKLIVVVHEPPEGTKLDVIGTGEHVGSPGVREFIERVQPDLVITGHIHEARAEEKIGDTPVINPGMLAGGGYVRIDYNDGELTAELKSV